MSNTPPFRLTNLTAQGITGPSCKITPNQKTLNQADKINKNKLQGTGSGSSDMTVSCLPSFSGYVLSFCLLYPRATKKQEKSHKNGDITKDIAPAGCLRHKF